MFITRDLYISCKCFDNLKCNWDTTKELLRFRLNDYLYHIVRTKCIMLIHKQNYGNTFKRTYTTHLKRSPIFLLEKVSFSNQLFVVCVDHLN